MTFTPFLLLVLCLHMAAHSAIYDCFMFNNELEILELRLHELYDHVDKFVIVESVENHRLGKQKPCYFELNQERFAPFKEKLIHIKLEERIEGDDGWVRENWQRNQIMRGLIDCDPEDLILISDVDEWIPGEIMQDLYRRSARFPMIGFWQKMYRWFLNRSTQQVWAGTAALRFKHLVQISPQEVRNRVRGAQMAMWHKGWHFTSLGGYQRAREKYDDLVEGYDDFITYEQWRDNVESCMLVPIDSSYPKYIQENSALLADQGLIDD